MNSVYSLNLINRKLKSFTYLDVFKNLDKSSEYETLYYIIVFSPKSSNQLIHHKYYVKFYLEYSSEPFTYGYLQ